MSVKELLLEDRDNIYQVGGIIYYHEERKDMALRLPENYQEWADVFSQDKI